MQMIIVYRHIILPDLVTVKKMAQNTMRNNKKIKTKNCLKKNEIEKLLAKTNKGKIIEDPHYHYQE